MFLITMLLAQYIDNTFYRAVWLQINKEVIIDCKLKYDSQLFKLVTQMIMLCIE